MAWSEDRLHRWLVRTFGGPKQRDGIGHDAACVSGVGARLALCVDQCIEGVHFLAGTAPRHIAAKAVGRALSDLAASAAEPRAVLLALQAGPAVPEAQLRSLIQNVAQAANTWGARLVGGDLACAPGPLSLSVTALGTAPKDPPRRDRARPGDCVLLTGAVGGSLLGRHLRIRPRLAEGRWLYARGVRVLMDVSDGLAWDLFRLARLSAVQIELQTVPIHPDAQRRARQTGQSAHWHALHDGEDHELIATVAPARLDRIQKEAAQQCQSLCVIGRVQAGRGLLIPGAHGRSVRWKNEGGWRHGSP